MLCLPHVSIDVTHCQGLLDLDRHVSKDSDTCVLNPIQNFNARCIAKLNAKRYHVGLFEQPATLCHTSIAYSVQYTIACLYGNLLGEWVNVLYGEMVQVRVFALLQ